MGALNAEGIRGAAVSIHVVRERGSSVPCSFDPTSRSERQRKRGRRGRRRSICRDRDRGRALSWVVNHSREGRDREARAQSERGPRHWRGWAQR